LAVFFFQIAFKLNPGLNKRFVSAGDDGDDTGVVGGCGDDGDRVGAGGVSAAKSLGWAFENGDMLGPEG